LNQPVNRTSSLAEPIKNTTAAFTQPQNKTATLIKQKLNNAIKSAVKPDNSTKKLKPINSLNQMGPRNLTTNYRSTDKENMPYPDYDTRSWAYDSKTSYAQKAKK
jgi:hypothetical protein